MCERPYTEETILKWLQCKAAVILLAAYLGIVTNEAPVCSKCSQATKWNESTFAFEHQCKQYRKRKFDIFNTSRILQQVRAGYRTNFLRFVFHFFMGSMLLKNCATLSGIAPNSANSYRSLLQDICSYALKKWQFNFQGIVQWDGSWLGHTHSISDHQFIYWRVLEQDFNIKLRHRRRTLRIDSESVSNIKKTGILSQIPQNTICLGDHGPMNTSKEIANSYITRGVTHSKGIFSDPKKMHLRYNEKVSSNLVENSNKADKISNAAANGLGFANKNPHARQRWLDVSDFKNNFTDMNAKDVFKVWLLAFACYENEVRDTAY